MPEDVSIVYHESTRSIFVKSVRKGLGVNLKCDLDSAIILSAIIGLGGKVVDSNGEVKVRN